MVNPSENPWPKRISQFLDKWFLVLFVIIILFARWIRGVPLDIFTFILAAGLIVVWVLDEYLIEDWADHLSMKYLSHRWWSWWYWTIAFGYIFFKMALWIILFFLAVDVL